MMKYSDLSKKYCERVEIDSKYLLHCPTDHPWGPLSMFSINHIYSSLDTLQTLSHLMPDWKEMEMSDPSSVTSSAYLIFDAIGTMIENSDDYFFLVCILFLSFIK
jgi:hypothetical protein